MKLQKKQEKDLKELERKGQKRREEILQKYSSAFSDLHTQINKKPSRKGQKKKYVCTLLMFVVSDALEILE